MRCRALSRLSCKIISNKREWNNCFIKYQTLDKNISNFIFYSRVFNHLEEKFSVIKLSVSIFGQTSGYRIYTVIGYNQITRNSISSVWYLIITTKLQYRYSTVMYYMTDCTYSKYTLFTSNTSGTDTASCISSCSSIDSSKCLGLFFVLVWNLRK